MGSGSLLWQSILGKRVFSYLGFNRSQVSKATEDEAATPSHPHFLFASSKSKCCCGLVSLSGSVFLSADGRGTRFYR